MGEEEELVHLVNMLLVFVLQQGKKKTFQVMSVLIRSLPFQQSLHVSGV